MRHPRPSSRPGPDHSSDERLRSRSTKTKQPDPSREAHQQDDGDRLACGPAVRLHFFIDPAVQNGCSDHPSRKGRHGCLGHRKKGPSKEIPRKFLTCA